MSRLYSSERGETVQNPGGKGHEPACAWDRGAVGGCSPAAAQREAVFPPKNETEQRKPTTDRQREAKQKAKLPRCHRSCRVATRWAGAGGRGSPSLVGPWGCQGSGLLTPPAQRCPGRGQGTSQQTRASGCGCCWGLRVLVPRASSDRSSPPGWVQHPAAPPPWHPLWWEHKQHLSSTQVLPSDTLRALQAPERSSQDA